MKSVVLRLLEILFITRGAENAFAQLPVSFLLARQFHCRGLQYKARIEEMEPKKKGGTVSSTYLIQFRNPVFLSLDRPKDLIT